MRNVRTVYRVEHSKETYGNLPVGPYTYLYVKSQKGKLTEQEEVLFEFLRKYEAKGLNPRKAKRGYGKPLFATFVDRRPGPKEDPYIRDYFISIIPWSSEYRYAFDSIEQLSQWFFCQDERRVLHELGFVISEYYVQNVRMGLRQVIFREHDVKKFKRHLPLTYSGA